MIHERLKNGGTDKNLPCSRRFSRSAELHLRYLRQSSARRPRHCPGLGVVAGRSNGSNIRQRRQSGGCQGVEDVRRKSCGDERRTGGNGIVPQQGRCLRLYVAVVVTTRCCWCRVLPEAGGDCRGEFGKDRGENWPAETAPPAEASAAFIAGIAMAAIDLLCIDGTTGDDDEAALRLGDVPCGTGRPPCGDERPEFVNRGESVSTTEGATAACCFFRNWSRCSCFWSSCTCSRCGDRRCCCRFFWLPIDQG